MFNKLLMVLMIFHSGSTFADIELISVKRGSTKCDIQVELIEKPNYVNEYVGIPYTKWKMTKNFTKDVIPLSIKLTVNIIEKSQGCEKLELPESGAFNIYLPDSKKYKYLNKNETTKIQFLLFDNGFAHIIDI